MRTSHTSAYQEMMIGNCGLIESAELRRSLIPVCSTLRRSATAMVTIMYLMDSTPSQSSSCSTAAKT